MNDRADKILMVCLYLLLGTLVIWSIAAIILAIHLVIQQLS